MLESAERSTRGGQDAAHKDLRRLVQGLEALTDPDPARGEIASVERQLELARQSRKKTIDDVWDLWQAAVRSIADSGKSPLYGGLVLAPQEGLIPLGQDPGTGLWEFGHLQTGSAPLRDGDGSLSIEPESGLVLVLIPGSQDQEPFFLSRRKMTKEQWQRGTGERLGLPEASGAEPQPGPGSPMTLVTWNECVTVLAHLGLTLPTLAEWQHAAAGPRSAAGVPPTRVSGFGLEGLRDAVQEWSLDWAPNGRGRAILGGAPGAGGDGGAGVDLAAPEHRGAELGLRPARRIVERAK